MLRVLWVFRELTKFCKKAMAFWQFVTKGSSFYYGLKG